jgi:hypothetical protein
MPAAGTVSLSFSAATGRTYRVEYKDELSALTWRPIAAERQATGPLMIVADTSRGQSQRFYRVVLVP